MKIALLDGYNLMHRARFGMKNGDMHIVFNFFRSLRPIIAELKPDKVYLVLEGVPQHRLQADSDYKANRVIEPGTQHAEEMAEFRRQKRIILESLRNFPITTVKHQDLECDDTIAALCVNDHLNDDCTIVSTDTDFIQLLDGSDRIKIFNPVKKEYVQPAPYDYLMWKALRGDKTDNVPRVDGMTDKKAEKILADPAKLDAVKNDPTLSVQLDRNLELIRFKTDIKSGYIFESPVPNFDAARQQFRDFKFFSMVNDTAWNNYTKSFQRLL